MSGVIKSSASAGLVLPMASGNATTASVVPLSQHDEERDTLIRRIALLEKLLHERDAELGQLRSKAENDAEDAREQGYDAGLSAAQDRQSERLSLLEAAMSGARDELQDALAALPRLAALLAQDCVDIILGDATDRAEFIHRIIEDQSSRIGRGMIVAIQVSRLDFPDAEALATLNSRLTMVNVITTADDGIASGGCSMTLRLGSFSVGLNQQWPVLRGLLDQMAAPERAP